jgi:ferredoxin-nitrite reductase
MSSDFTSEQKRYLEGFASGMQIARTSRGSGDRSAASGEHAGPDAPHLVAQDKVIAAGGKLSEQEKFKRDEHPFDAYARLKEQAAKKEFPKPATISAGAITVFSTSRPRRTRTCAGCASTTAS